MAVDKVMAKIKSDLVGAKYETILCSEKMLAPYMCPFYVQTVLLFQRVVP